MLIYEKYNRRCAYCGNELEYKDMQVDHINSVYVNTDLWQSMSDEQMYDIKNLLPSCRQCNFYKSTFTVEKFRERLQTTLIGKHKKNFTLETCRKIWTCSIHST